MDIAIKRMMIKDFGWILLALLILVASFILEKIYHHEEVFQRAGALLVLCGATLSLKVQKRTLLGRTDTIRSMQKINASILLSISKVDSMCKSMIRENVAVIESSGLESPWGPAEKIKDMELPSFIKDDIKLKPTPKKWLIYHKSIETFGSIFLWFGTIIWSFGDQIINLV